MALDFSGGKIKEGSYKPPGEANPNRAFTGTTGSTATATTAQGTYTSTGRGAGEQSDTEFKPAPTFTTATPQSFNIAPAKTITNRQGEIIGFESAQAQQSYYAGTGSRYTQGAIQEYEQSIAQQRAIQEQNKPKEIFTPETLYSRPSEQTIFLTGGTVKGYETPYFGGMSVLLGKNERMPLSEFKYTEQQLVAQKYFSMQPKQETVQEELISGIPKGKYKDFLELLPGVIAEGNIPEQKKSWFSFDMKEVLGLQRTASIQYTESGKAFLGLRPESEYGAYTFSKEINYPESWRAQKRYKFMTKPIFNINYKLTPVDIFGVEQTPSLAIAYGTGFAFGGTSTLLSSIGVKSATTVDLLGKGLLTGYVVSEIPKIVTPIYEGIKTKDITQFQGGLSIIGTDILQTSAFIGGAKVGSQFIMGGGFTPRASTLPQIKYRKISIESEMAESISQESLFGKRFKVEPFEMTNEKVLYRGFQIETIKNQDITVKNLIGIKSRVKSEITKIEPLYDLRRAQIPELSTEKVVSFRGTPLVNRNVGARLITGKAPKFDFSNYPDTKFTMESLANPMTEKVALQSSQWIKEPSGIIGGKEQFRLLTRLEAEVKETGITVYHPIEKVESFKTSEAFVYYIESLGTKWKTLEFGARGKASSIGTLRISKGGELYIAPETHREKDIGDYFTLKTEHIERNVGSMKKLNELKLLYKYRAEEIKMEVTDISFVETISLKNPFKGVRTYFLKRGAENYGFVAYKAQVRGATRLSGDIDTDMIRSEKFSSSFAERKATELKTKFGEPTFWEKENPFLIQTTQGGRSHLGDIHPRGLTSYAQAPESFYGRRYDVRTVNMNEIKVVHTKGAKQLEFKPMDLAEPKSLLPKKLNWMPSGIISMPKSAGAFGISSVTALRTPSKSLSQSLSKSAFPSASISSGISTSLSKSISPSISKSLSASVSRSLSRSISSSVSTSPSLSMSVSPSLSRSMSLSPSVSPSRSPSRSPSILPSISPSITPSPSLFYSGIGDKLGKKKGKKSKSLFTGMKMPTLNVSLGLTNLGKMPYPKKITGLESRNWPKFK